MSNLTAFVLLAGLFAGPVPEAPSAAESLRAADQALSAALQAGDASAFRDLLSEDCRSLGREPAIGRERVVTAWAAHFRTDPPDRMRWKTEQVEVSASGDLGYAWGEFERIVGLGADRAQRLRGEVASVWRRSAGGKWQAVLLVASPGKPVGIVSPVQ